MVFVLGAAGAAPPALAWTATQLSDGNVVVTAPSARLFQCVNAYGYLYQSGILLGQYAPPTWVPFGRASTSGHLDVVVTATHWIQPIGGANLPLDVDGVILVLDGMPGGSTYSVYQLRTSTVPSILPTAAASGTVTGGTIDVPLSNTGGNFIHVRIFDRNGDPLLSSFRNNGAGVAEYRSGPRAFISPYGAVSDQGGVGTVYYTLGMYNVYDSGTAVRMNVGDYVLGQPSIDMAGTVLHAAKPTLIRYGLGSMSAVNSVTPGPAVDTPSGSKILTFRPAFDSTGTNTQLTSGQLMVPKEHLILSNRADFGCSPAIPSYSVANSNFVWHRVGVASIPSSSFTLPTAGTVVAPTAPVYTGIFGGEGLTVAVPGAPGLFVATDIFTPVLPDRAAPPDTTSILDVNSLRSVMTTGGLSFYTVMVRTDWATSADCSLRPDLHSFPTPPRLVLVNDGDRRTVSGHERFYFSWLRSAPNLPALTGAVGVGDIDGQYNLTCRATLADGSKVNETIKVGLGTVPAAAALGVGAQTFLTAYEDDTFGWGSPDFLGLGLVGVMGILSAMAGFSRKNLPASAIVFAVVIGAFGWLGLMDVPEVVMSGITVAAILIVFQRTGAR